jgi:hypothetical protein
MHRTSLYFGVRHFGVWAFSVSAMLACSAQSGSSTGDTGVQASLGETSNGESPDGDGDGDTTPGDGDPGDGDGDGNPGDGDPDDDGGLPKFDLSPVPDAAGMMGGQIGIPETCAAAEDTASAVGCLFFGHDLDNLSSGETQPYAIVVSNVQEDEPATVEIEVKQGGNWVTVAGPQMIAPLDLYSFELPDNHQEGSGLRVGGGYRVTSDVPVVAYEFNPINGQDSYTTDASLLYPVPSYDYIYQVLGYHVTLSYGSYVVIIGSEDGTTVEVTPPVATAAGPGIPAGSPGIPFQIDLDEGDVAQIATETDMTSLTGMQIVTDDNTPIGVISGTECTNTGAGACDHMEDMLTGVRLWGMEFVAARMPIRQVNDPEDTIWQIYASEDNTTVTIDAHPDVTGLPPNPIQLDKGEYQEFWASGSIANPGDFHVTADKPIALMSYLVGINDGQGDPAMMLVGPVQQYLPRYVVLVPGTWVSDYLVITRLAGAQVEVDGLAVPDNEFLPVGNGDYEVARILTPDGVHTVDGLGDPCSVSVVGFDDYDSYAYLGGVGTSVINPDPAG